MRAPCAQAAWGVGDADHRAGTACAAGRTGLSALAGTAAPGKWKPRRAQSTKQGVPRFATENKKNKFRKKTKKEEGASLSPAEKKR